MNKMNIKSLFISYNGALEPLLQSQGISYLKGLSKKGIKPFLLTFEKPEQKEIYTRKNIGKLQKELESHGIRWYFLRYHKWPSLPATLFDMLIGVIVGLYLCVSKRIDIIHARGTVSAAIGYAISRVTRKKFIFDVRGLMADEYVDGGIWKRDSFSYRLVFYFEKIFLKSADELIVLTKKIKKVLINKNKNIDIIPCCVDVLGFNKSSKLTEGLRKKYNLSGKFVFLYVGSIGTWYLLDEMLDLFRIAKGIISNVHFLVLTHGDLQIVNDLCKKRGISGDDITIDKVEFKDISDHIKLADVGIFFIKPVFSKSASSPTKFAEYLACGLPVIINSNIGDTEEVVISDRVGVVIKDFNNAEYVKGVENLLRLIEEGEALKKRCLDVAERDFSLERGVEQYYGVYKRLIL
ncbi:MAG: glycosyltransferase family 4 protein [Candidatus Omnitrophota bacterium]